MVKSKETWNVIMIDAYRGPFVPFHLLTEEFFKVVKSKLKPGGVVVQNIEPSTMMFDSAVATIQRVFANVELYDAGGNVVAVAYDGPQRTAGAAAAHAPARCRRSIASAIRSPFSCRSGASSPAPSRARCSPTTSPPSNRCSAIEKHNRKLDDISEPAAK